MLVAAPMHHKQRSLALLLRCTRMRFGARKLFAARFKSGVLALRALAV